MLHTSKSTLSLAALLAFLGAGENAMSLEQPSYTVVYQDGDVEYRRYEPYVVSETIVRDAEDFKGAGNEGFRRLFDYISGANRSRAKIAMTAPVERTPINEKIAMTAPVQQMNSADGWRVTFMLPSEFSLETAPVPTDDRVQIKQIPGRLMAVLRYSGRWTEKNFAEKLSSLQQALERDSIKPRGEFQSAAYDPPFMPPFMRRNEVMVEVDQLPDR